MIETVDERRVDIPKRHSSRGEPLLDNEPATLPDLFRRAVAKHDLRDALNRKHRHEWLPISSHEMISRIENIASGLHALG
ncbi:MAG TPA: hypothetical protein VMZ26_10995, partial [Pyrinomonadaceae bacterium]|nr:hypothetical protein [Pyrinomonadaceae bacterium]